MSLRSFTLAAIAGLSLIALSSNAWASDSGTDRFQAACDKDIQAYCPDVEPGEGRIMACLRAHKDQVSEECRKFHAGHAHSRLIQPAPQLNRTQPE